MMRDRSATFAIVLLGSTTLNALPAHSQFRIPGIPVPNIPVPSIPIPNIPVPGPVQDVIDAAEKARRDAEAALEKAKRDAEAAAEKAKKDAEATLEKARKDAEAAAEKAKKDAEATAEKARKDAEATLEKAKKDAEATAEKARKDTEATLETARKDLVANLEKAAEDSARAYVKAWADTAGAVKALGKFAERQLAGKGEILDAAQRRIQEGKFVDALWHVSADQVGQTSTNAGKAAQESAVLNAAAATAATAYGGPGGAAAYAAWYTYNQTRDLGLALKAGVVSGALSVGLPPGVGVGGQVAAGAAKGTAVAVIEGGDVESMKKAMISGAVAGGIQGIGQLPEGTTAEVAKKAVVAGALGGIAVAAVGGDEKAIKDAFLKEGGRVVVQYAQREARTIGSALIKEADTICVSAVGETCEAAATAVRDVQAKYSGVVEQGVAVRDGQWALSWDQNIIQAASFPSIVVTIEAQKSP